MIPKVKEFLNYFNSFYGPKGLYPQTIPRYTQVQVLAGIVTRGIHFEGDSIDRELIRDSIRTLQGKTDSEHAEWMRLK